ncbi:hypothetical protein EVAR_36566_1 [Eumeta japonica]|uniref:Uncharacterized protein n=1 Tax=Eumeta variegata TaxID=151549 RepID=A0A4C1Y1E8_EUMVA|nr:hypothetical protein EVAR_36566_1 [Eumeta japonica]
MDHFLLKHPSANNGADSDDVTDRSRSLFVDVVTNAPNRTFANKKVYDIKKFGGKTEAAQKGTIKRTPLSRDMQHEDLALVVPVQHRPPTIKLTKPVIRSSFPWRFILEVKLIEQNRTVFERIIIFHANNSSDCKEHARRVSNKAFHRPSHASMQLHERAPFTKARKAGAGGASVCIHTACAVMGYAVSVVNYR